LRTSCQQDVNAPPPDCDESTAVSVHPLNRRLGFPGDSTLGQLYDATEFEAYHQIGAATVQDAAEHCQPPITPMLRILATTSLNGETL